MLVGGIFAATGAVPTFSTYGLILFVVGLLLFIGVGVRAAGTAVVLIMLWHMGVGIDLSASILDNFNAVKREFAFLAAGIILVSLGGGSRFTPSDILKRSREYLNAYRNNHNK